MQYTKDSVEKTYWANVGTMTVFQKDDGSVSRIMEIPAIGLKANIFPITPKTATSAPVATAPTAPETDISPAEIPF